MDSYISVNAELRREKKEKERHVKKQLGEEESILQLEREEVDSIQESKLAAVVRFSALANAPERFARSVVVTS